jgi:CheY-like chemotaxis protein
VKNKRVLLVEDDPLAVELMCAAMSESGFDAGVDIADSAEDAFLILDEYKKFHLLPSLAMLLLDLQLPGMSGIDFLKIIKTSEYFRMIPVVILTSSAEPGDILACYSNGANSYLEKPSSYRELCRLASELNTYWMTMNRPPPEDTA